MTDIRAQRSAVAARRRFEARELLENLKSKPCVDCGHTYHTCQMDWWQRTPNQIHISQRLQMSKARILEEVAKCDLVCANCHRLRTWNRQRMIRSEPT